MTASAAARLRQLAPAVLGAVLGALLCAALAGCAAEAPTAARPASIGTASTATASATVPAETAARVARYGGPFEDARLDAYVDRVGQRVLAATGEATGRPITFTVLDSSALQAFPAPDGRIYVTRGLLAIMNSEDELAAVLAHEIAHIAAEHQAARSVATTALLNRLDGASTIARLGAVLNLLSYGRAQELEADSLGVGYLARAGYDPAAMAGFLRQLEREEALRSALGADAPPPEFLATHPASAERHRLAEAEARSLGAAQGSGGRAGGDRGALLAMLDGLPWGDDEDFAVDGRTVVSQELGITLAAPLGWTLQAVQGGVVAHHGAGGTAALDWEPVPPGTTPEAYLGGTRPPGPLGAVERLTINGFDAATTVFQAKTRRGPIDVRLLVVRVDAGHLARFVFVTPPPATEALDEDIRSFAYSIRPAPPASLAAAAPPRIAVVTVQPGDTPASLARRMAVDHGLERFLALNGLDSEAAALPAGMQVKLILR